LLVDKDKVGPSSLRAIKSMMVMQPPPSFTVSPLPALTTQSKIAFTKEFLFTNIKRLSGNCLCHVLRVVVE